MAVARPLAPLWNSLVLDRAAALSLQDQIVTYFRDATLAGRLRAGARVPSSRQLAAEHGVARITVVQAYERLVSEGYLVARRGAGLFVADSVPDHLALPVAASGDDRPLRASVAQPLAAMALAGMALTVPSRPLEPLPLFVGIPALDRFPWSDWGRISARVHRERPLRALSYGDPTGEPHLRAAIAEYLALARGIDCTAAQILVVAGSQQGIALVARALAAPGDKVWFEEPGYPIGRAAFAAAGLTTVPVPVDAEGLDVAAGMRLAPDARLALVAPSHQYPLGPMMSLRRRLALLDWAEAAGAWVVEDDYDGEFRYAGRPLAPLHTLDRGGRVLYLGTFSKVLAPGLRVGYLVVPQALVPRFAALKAASDRHAPGLTQHVLARFIAEGRLAQHIRRMRLLYAQRRRALVEALAREAGGLLEADDAPPAGLHLVARLRVAVDDAAIFERALLLRLHAAPLSGYYAGDVKRHGFVLGFAGTPEEQIAPSVHRLAAVVREADAEIGAAPNRTAKKIPQLTKS